MQFLAEKPLPAPTHPFYPPPPLEDGNEDEGQEEREKKKKDWRMMCGGTVSFQKGEGGSMPFLMLSLP